MIPDLLKYVSGVDLVAATVEVALGNYELNLDYKEDPTIFYSTYNIHSKHDGVLKKIIFKNEIQKNIIDKVIYTRTGSKVERFSGANKALGILFLKFDSLEEMEQKMGKINQYVEIYLED